MIPSSGETATQRAGREAIDRAVRRELQALLESDLFADHSAAWALLEELAAVHRMWGWLP